MKTQLEILYKKSKKETSDLKALSNRYLATVYKGLTNGKKVREIHKDIRRVTMWQVNHDLPYTKEQEALAMKIAKKKPDGDVYDFFKKQDYYHMFLLLIFKFIRKKKGNNKKKIIRITVDDNRQYVTPDDYGKAKIFYLASSHDDCAEDHWDYQGRMYIDSAWKNLIKDEKLKSKIYTYIANNGVKTLQWVTGDPVWFITRPNCRHYFKSITVDEALKFSVEELSRKYKMHRKVGLRETRQTIYHPTNKSWYTRENVEGIINKYKERLAYLESLYQAKKTPNLEKDIEKTKFLIKKWETIYKRNNRVV